MLIQCLWRCYAADKCFNSQATWDIYIKEPGHPKDNSSLSKVSIVFRKVREGNLMAMRDKNVGRFFFLIMFAVVDHASGETRQRLEAKEVEKQNGQPRNVDDQQQQGLPASSNITAPAQP